MATTQWAGFEARDEGGFVPYTWEAKPSWAQECVKKDLFGPCHSKEPPQDDPSLSVMDEIPSMGIFEESPGNGRFNA